MYAMLFILHSMFFRSECAGFLDECDPDNPCKNPAKFCENVSGTVDFRLRGELRFFCPSGKISFTDLLYFRLTLH